MFQTFSQIFERTDSVDLTRTNQKGDLTFLSIKLAQRDWWDGNRSTQTCLKQNTKTESSKDHNPRNWMTMSDINRVVPKKWDK